MKCGWKKGDVPKWIRENQGKHICKCGCGDLITILRHHHSRGIPDFINGHFSRIANPMTGKSGEANPHYKGGKRINEAGYVLVLIPGPGPSQYELEHRFVMQKHLGRQLDPGEVVHHKNKIKTDNRLENLEVKTSSQHSRDHVKDGDMGFARVYERAGGCPWFGEKHHSAKLTENDVKEIRQLASEGKTRRELAESYRVTTALIKSICERKSWKHLP